MTTPDAPTPRIEQCAAQARIADLLRKIPIDLRTEIPMKWTLGSSFVPVGAYSHAAARRIDDLERENAKLKAENEALREDAERGRFLVEAFVEMAVDGKSLRADRLGKICAEPKTREEVIATIDQAIAGGKDAEG